MKKAIAVIMAGLSISMASAASAEPVKLTGDAAIKYQKDTAAGEPDASGSVYTLKLMGEAELGAGWALYGRLGVQRASVPSLADFNTGPEAYGENDKTVAALDQFGLIHKTDKYTLKLGRQDAAVGASALLYSRPDSNIGRKAFVDGLAVSGAMGDMDLSVLAAREDNAAGEYKNKVYAIRSGWSPVENFSWGLTLGRFHEEADSTNHWAVDGTYKFGRNSLTAEFTKASSDDDNKAYAVIWNYELDDRTAVSVTGFRVEEFGSMGGQSDFDAGNRGLHYGISRALSDAASLDIVYKDQKTISGGQKNTSFEAAVSYTF